MSTTGCPKEVTSFRSHAIGKAATSSASCISLEATCTGPVAHGLRFALLSIKGHTRGTAHASIATNRSSFRGLLLLLSTKHGAGRVILLLLHITLLLHHLRGFISVHFRLLSVVLIPVVVLHHIIIVTIVIVIQGKVVLIEACSSRATAALLSPLVEVYIG